MMGARDISLPGASGGATRRAFKFVLLILAAAFFVQSVVAVQFSPVAFARGMPDLANLVSRMFPPSIEYVPRAAGAALQTVQMALVGTTVGALLSVPLAFAAANNVTPHALFYRGARSLVGFIRSIPDLIWGLLFVSAVGLGPFPGTVALTLGSIGMLGKLYAEAIEEIDPGQVEALRSTGAHPLQTLALGVVPQVVPSFVALTLYRWDINIRDSIVLGLVGAGGIGFELQTSMRLFRYPEVLTMIVVILLIVLLVEHLSQHVRQRVI